MRLDAGEFVLAREVRQREVIARSSPFMNA
jgi:hypothetical protein